MVAGVEMIFVLDSLWLQLLVQGSGAILETEVILLAAIEVDGKISQRQAVLREQKILFCCQWATLRARRMRVP